MFDVWSFFSAFAVCVCLCGGCSFHPLFAQGDLQNADIPPTEVIDIEPEPDELDFPPEIPDFPPELPEIDFWEYWDEEYFPVFGFAGVTPLLAQIDPVIPPPDDDDPGEPPVEEVIVDPIDPQQNEPGGGSSSGSGSSPGSSSGSAGGGTVGLTPEIPAAWSDFSLVGVFSAIVGPIALAIATGLGLVVGVWLCAYLWVKLRGTVR